ncbi:large ribosomal subunit protein bL19m-like [Ptychodera flava]|uniref:large ribosomal subunit protein bL19m-like n=1 Tax=Ptychodera flava TaxID=63121 RepID=UPI00396A8EE1
MATTMAGTVQQCVSLLRQVSLRGAPYVRCISSTCARQGKQPSSQPGDNLKEHSQMDYWKIPEEEGKPRRFISPEFFPPKHRPGRRSKLRDHLERQDMLKRRKVLNIPEFYVGSILAITMADPHAVGKKNRFVGICIKRSGLGLGATCLLRNVIDGLGTEICYEIYSPLIQKIEVLKLEKSVDDHLLYLRDALPQYCTVDPDMSPVKHSPNDPVPISDTKVRMKPRPWSRKWERFHLQGIDYSRVTLRPKDIKAAEDWKAPWRKEDFARKYAQPKDVLQQIRQELDEFEEEVERESAQKEMK